MKNKYNSNILKKLMYQRKLDQYEKEHNMYYTLATICPKIQDDKYELKLINKIKAYEKLIKNLPI